MAIKKVMANVKLSFTSPSKFFTFFENSPCPKNIQEQLEIDTNGKYVPVVYIGGISTALCARVFDAHVFLVIIPPWGELLQFSWVKLLHHTL